MDTHSYINSLSEAQQRELYSTLAYTYGRQGSKQSQDSLTPDENLIWDAINDVMGQRRNLGDVLAKCGKDYSRDSFREDVEYITSWLNRGCGRVINRTQRLAIVNIAMQCLKRYISRGDAPVIHKTLVQQLMKIPAAMDRAYPGYQEAGVLDRIAAIAS